MSPFNLDNNRPVYVEINRADHGFSGAIHQGDPNHAFPLPELALGPEERPVTGQSWCMKDLTTAIIRFAKNDRKAFDERVQLEVGRHLFQETLGRLPEPARSALREQRALRIRILSNHEWIAGLPWNLMVRNGVFCCTIGWSVSICCRPVSADCELPPSPRLLVIAPEPTGIGATRAHDHIESLVDALSISDPKLSSDQHLKIVRSWNDFLSEAETFQPQLIYYYGHGVGDWRTTRLVFAADGTGRRVDKPVADFAQALTRLKEPPFLAYINCCQGDAGGFLGAGMQLGAFIPAVITNRTVAEIDVAQDQALNLWKKVLIQALPLDKAVAELYSGMDLRRLTTADYRWITPVLHAHYADWKARRPTPPDRLVQDPHWHLKIDRVNQYNAVIAQTRLMMRERKPKSLVFVWYGREGDGVELFHKRLRVELREEMTGAEVFTIRPRWPEHLTDYHSAFSDVFCEAFRVNALDDIPARLRSETHGRTTLLYVCHEPVRSVKLINPQSLRRYVEWWDAEFVPRLENRQFALLTVSFLVKNPPAFAAYVAGERIEERDLKYTVFWLLDEMEKVAKRDLLLFLRTHNIDLPTERRDTVLDDILKRTEGRYEQTVEALKKLRQEAWRFKGGEAAEMSESAPQYDY